MPTIDELQDSSNYIETHIVAPYFWSSLSFADTRRSVHSAQGRAPAVPLAWHRRRAILTSTLIVLYSTPAYRPVGSHGHPGDDADAFMKTSLVNMSHDCEHVVGHHGVRNSQ
jgi:hypothetical protein